LLDHWRFAVISSVAKVIFGEHADPTCSAFCPDSSQVFFELVQNLSWEDHIHIFTASRTWPKGLQDDFGLAMKRPEKEHELLSEISGSKRDFESPN
jgi:hypothetical protein